MVLRLKPDCCAKDRVLQLSRIARKRLQRGSQNLFHGTRTWRDTTAFALPSEQARTIFAAGLRSGMASPAFQRVPLILCRR
jgi:hypothetical protein